MTTPEPGQFGPPPTDAFGAPVPPQATPYGYAPMPPAAQPKNIGAAIAVGFGAMIVGALAYGFIMKATEHEIGWVAFGLAFLVALPLGKMGGRNAVLPIVGLVFSALGVFLGQLFGVALVIHQVAGVDLTELFGARLSDTMDVWKQSLDIKDVLFYGIAAVEGFLVTRRFGLAS